MKQISPPQLALRKWEEEEKLLTHTSEEFEVVHHTCFIQGFIQGSRMWSAPGFSLTISPLYFLAPLAPSSASLFMLQRWLPTAPGATSFHISIQIRNRTVSAQVVPNKSHEVHPARRMLIWYAHFCNITVARRITHHYLLKSTSCHPQRWGKVNGEVVVSQKKLWETVTKN